MKIRIGEGELKLLGNGQIEELSFRDGSIFPKGQFSWLIRAFRDRIISDICKITGRKIRFYDQELWSCR